MLLQCLCHHVEVSTRTHATVRSLQLARNGSCASLSCVSSVGMCTGKLVREVQTEEEELQKARSAYMCCERCIQLPDYVLHALCLLSSLNLLH